MSRVITCVTFCFSILCSVSASEGLDTNLVGAVAFVIDSIDAENEKYGSTSNKYDIFVLSVGDCQANNIDPCCFSVSYIMNSADLQFLKSSHYFELQDEIILVDFENEDDTTRLAEIVELSRIDSIARQRVLDRLFPSEYGGFTYTPFGVLFCYAKNGLTVEFFDDEEQMELNSRTFDQLEFERVKIYSPKDSLLD